MARAFLYDLGTIDLTIIDGTMTGSPYAFVPGDDITDEYLMNDQGIIFDVTVANTNAIRCNFVTELTPTILAIYVDEDSGVGDIAVTRANGDGAAATTHTASMTLAIGWNILALTGAATDWFIRFDATMDIGEIFFGFKYEFGYTPDKGEIDDAEYGITDLQSYGGNEYSNRRHSKKDLFGWDWRFIDNTMYAALKAFKNQVEGTRLKYLYYDESDYNWVKMLSGSLKFKKMGYQVWETTIQMRGQLS